MMLALILIPLYAFADRFAGGGLPALDARLPGRAAFWGALVCAVAGFLTLGWPGAALAAVWLVWRTLPWKAVPPGSATPHTTGEIAATFVRHAVPFLVGGFVVWQGLAVRPITLSPLAGFAVAATGLSVWYSAAVRHAEAYGGDAQSENAFQELARGAAFGLAVSLMGIL